MRIALEHCYTTPDNDVFHEYLDECVKNPEMPPDLSETYTISLANPPNLIKHPSNFFEGESQGLTTDVDLDDDEEKPSNILQSSIFKNAVYILANPKQSRMRRFKRRKSLQSLSE